MAAVSGSQRLPEGWPQASSTPPQGQLRRGVKPHLEAVVRTAPGTPTKALPPLRAAAWPRSRAGLHAAASLADWAPAHSKVNTWARRKERKHLFRSGMLPL